MISFLTPDYATFTDPHWTSEPNSDRVTRNAYSYHSEYVYCQHIDKQLDGSWICYVFTDEHIDIVVRAVCPTLRAAKIWWNRHLNDFDLKCV